MTGHSFDLIVIGAGPGGYVAAIRAAQLGMTVAVVERRPELGGVCLNEGCIPSKALLESSELFAKARDQFALHGICIEPPKVDLSVMMQRKDAVISKLREGIVYLFNKFGVTCYNGSARLAHPTADGRHAVEIVPVNSISDKSPQQLPSHQAKSNITLIGAKVLLATGSEPIGLPSINFDRQIVVSAREAMSFPKLPRHLVVVGGGYVGLEMASVWSRLGSQVTVIEKQSQILTSMDRQIVETIYRSLRRQGIQFRLDTMISDVGRGNSSAVVKIECGGNTEAIECDRLLVAVGRSPVIAGTGIVEAGILLNQNGKVLVDEDFQTSLRGVYAVGDLIPGPMLAHKASEEAVVCVERMVGYQSSLAYEYIPGIVYTSPEGAYVGKSEERLKEDGVNYKVGRCNFTSNGRARCLNETEGFVKILAEQETGRLLGIHIVGQRAADLIAEAVTVMAMGGTPSDIAKSCHAHPTLSEALKEAALDIYKKAIHV